MSAKRIVVLYGGFSTEREVSLVSGQACADALRSKGHDVALVDPADGVKTLVAALDPDRDIVFNALHGHLGEDGSVQGLLDLLRVPYTHSGLLASAVAMNKALSRDIFTRAGLRCAAGKLCTRDDFRDGHPLPPPYVIKPVAEGSSKGVRIVQAGDNAIASDEDWHYGDHVLVEKFIEGRELTVAVLDGKALAVTELRTSEGFYDYDSKYTAGRTQHLIPAPIPAEITEQALRWAEIAHTVLGCRSLSRSDFRYDDRPEAGSDGGLYILETNTQPGMTPLSLAPEQAAYVGISFADLVDGLVKTARYG
ncbi:D-alanine--D-alanine ligase [Pseudochelatococcus contaminans]|uniref:D-alanine--D-alanine ligase n=1 Tax=Pseudochelatococcus contaminans TaxID=1538103 RepID=A0A7W5Z366_9HYPH|nr:D-alanine--D-alanine ligase [Pseudochelatococcus contaminans]MBB3808959.1 D-alanine-D-alanine ligase [Pseudochelatococcus contaminans]